MNTHCLHFFGAVSSYDDASTIARAFMAVLVQLLRALQAVLALVLVLLQEQLKVLALTALLLQLQQQQLPRQLLSF